MRTGELSRSAQFRLILEATFEQARALPGTARRIPSTSPGWEAPVPPDSRLCREALDEARSTLSEAVLTHSLRCREWAWALAELDGLRPDPEELTVACMLHDVGLGAPDDAQCGCFTELGGRRAALFTVHHGGTEQAAASVRTAIVRHMDVVSPHTSGDVAVLLHAAAHLDVTGRRVHDLPPTVVASVLARHPVDGFAREFAAAMRREARIRPRSRAATLWKAGMALPIRLNPLARQRRSVGRSGTGTGHVLPQ
ncbi:HD domain-containing protein [Rhodococcus sp. ACT016]|uniref:HD domain-containing protein n=1 Tax=Rhodococcus sp. ACT016 TaxID=3134808 RepID=UPI003D2DC53C